MTQINYAGCDIHFFKPGDFNSTRVTKLVESENSISNYAKNKIRLLPPNSILTTCIGIIGKVGIIENEATCYQQINAFVPDESKCKSNYIAYVILRYSAHLNHIANAAVVPIVNKTKFLNLQIPLPSLEVQQKIADALDCSSALIEKRKAQIKKPDLLIKSQFIKMFGDPVTNSKEWDVNRLGKICDVITGNTPSRNKPDYYGAHTEWVKSDNINTPNMYLTQASEMLSETGLSIGRSVDSGTVLMTCIAGSLSCIGNVAITDRKVAFNQQINAIIPKENNA